MLTSNIYDADKLAALKALAGRPHLAEVVAIYWSDGVRYYSSAALQELPNFRDINRDGTPIIVEPRLPGASSQFPEVILTSDVGDETASLNFHDGDGDLTARFNAGAEGAKVELFYYLPQIDWFVSHWWGHLQPPTDVDLINFKASAACGIRSSQMSIPRVIFQHLCQNIFGGAQTTQTAIDSSLCPYNRQLGGAIGNLNSGVPFTSCPKTKEACLARLGNTLNFTGFDTAVINIVIGQSHGPATQAVSRGNETNLDRPLRRIYGYRVVRDLDLGAMRQEANTNHPDQGFLAALFWVCVGRIRSMTACSIINILVGAEHLNTRLGARQQPATAYAPNVLNFNGTAHFFGRVGPLNPGGYGASNVPGQCTVEGAADVRVFTGDDTFTEEYSTNPAWCFLDLYRSPFFGHGVDLSVLVMQDWIDLADWCDDVVSYTDPFGTVWSGTRHSFNADVQGRTAQAQFRDICLWHRFVPPFQHLGKLRTFPLRPLTEDELASVPVFYDDTPQRNILRAGGKPKISWSRQSDRDLPNQLQVTFEETDFSQNISNVERPVTFGDEQQQLRAGRSFGDTTVRVVPQKYQACGIIYEAELMRKGNQLLDVGELDGGGLKNNFRIKFTCHFAAGFELYQLQVIRVESALITRASAPLQEGGFKYFRVLSKTRNSDLSYEVTAQAYPELYWADAETVITLPNPYRYEAEDSAITLGGHAEVLDDETCSSGRKVTGLGLNGGDPGTLTFNNVTGEDGTARVTIAYKCDEDRDLLIRANSDAAQLVHCPASPGSAVARVVVVLSTHEGSDNTIAIFNPTARAPDVDVIFVVPFTIIIGGGGPCRPAFGEVEFTAGRIRIPIEPCCSEQ